MALAVFLFIPESWASFFTDLTTGCVLVSVDGHMVSAQMGFSKFKGILKQQPSVKTDPEGFVMVWQRPLAEPEPEPVPEPRFFETLEPDARAAMVQHLLKAVHHHGSCNEEVRRQSGWKFNLEPSQVAQLIAFVYQGQEPEPEPH